MLFVLVISHRSEGEGEGEALGGGGWVQDR